MTSFLCYPKSMILILMTSCAVAKVIDLSHKHGPKTLTSVYGSPRYNLTNLSKGEYLPGVYVETNYYGSSEHGGTHIDAPNHFVQGGLTLDELPIENTIAEGVMIDCSKEAAANHSYYVTLQKLQNWEKTFGKIPLDAAVLFYFGWYQKFDNEALYRGTTDLANRLTHVFPYVSVEAARWLLDQRRVRTVGSDTLTVDPFQVNNKASDFPIHRLLLSQNRTLIENLRDLDKLPARGFRFHASPVKYVGATGAQVRAYAITYDVQDNGAIVVDTAQVLVPCLVVLMQMLS